MGSPDFDGLSAAGRQSRGVGLIARGQPPVGLTLDCRVLAWARAFQEEEAAESLSILGRGTFLLYPKSGCLWLGSRL